MKIMTMIAAAACAFSLTACGGGSNDGSKALVNRADEGIWSNLNGTVPLDSGVQVVILRDGSYWGVVGYVQSNGAGFTVHGVLHGMANVNGNSVSGTYVDFSGLGSPNGAYSGTVSSKNSLALTFAEPANSILTLAGSNLVMNYDASYEQPAALSAIAGSYLNKLIGSFYSHPPGGPEYYYSHLNPTISGSNLTMMDQDGNIKMTGTVTPHGTDVNVFDVRLTTAVNIPVYSTTELFSTADVPAGTVYSGILFQTSSGILKNNIEIIATAGNSAYFYAGSKK